MNRKSLDARLTKHYVGAIPADAYDKKNEIMFNVLHSEQDVEDFCSQYENETDICFDDLVSQGIAFYHLSKVTSLAARLLDPKASVKTLIPKGKCYIKFDYPMETFFLEFKGIKTRLDLAKAVYVGYRGLYARNSGRKIKNPWANFVTNINGIKPSEVMVWGHCIEDLIAHSVVRSSRKGKIPTFTVSVSS